jgi:hypothetical protein
MPRPEPCSVYIEEGPAEWMTPGEAPCGVPVGGRSPCAAENQSGLLGHVPSLIKEKPRQCTAGPKVIKAIVVVDG